MDIIILEHVTKSFDGQKILEDFNLSVKEGEFLTVIGRSGCGKTTMLKLMNGLLTPDRGKVYVEGKNIAETDHYFSSAADWLCHSKPGIIPAYDSGKKYYLCSRDQRKEE